MSWTSEIELKTPQNHRYHTVDIFQSGKEHSRVLKCLNKSGPTVLANPLNATQFPIPAQECLIVFGSDRLIWEMYFLECYSMQLDTLWWAM